MEGSFGPHSLRLKVLHDSSSYPLCKLPQKFHSFLNLPSSHESTSNGKNTSSSSVVILITSVTDNSNEIYAVWGGQFSDKQAEDVIEVSVSAIIQSNRSHIALEAWKSNDIVSTYFLPSIAVADRIHLRPESSFDWDIVITQAIHVENQLLRSLAVVKQNQIVSIAVSASLKAHFLVERVETALLLSLSVARVANGTELVIAPYHAEKGISSQIITSSSSFSVGKKQTVLTVGEMIQKLSKLDISTASLQYPLRILPQLYRSQPSAYNLHEIHGKVVGESEELTDDYLDAFLDQRHDYHNSTAGIYPWNNVPLKDDEFTVYIHPVFITCILETAFDCQTITKDTLASFMTHTNYQQWVCMIYKDGLRSCVIKVVITDMIRVGHIAIPATIRRQMILYNFTPVHVEIIIRSRAIIPDGISLRPILWTVENKNNNNNHNEEKEKIMKFLKQYNLHHQQQSIVQVNPIIAALIRLIDGNQPGCLLLSHSAVVELVISTGQPPTTTLVQNSRRRSRQLSSSSSSSMTAATAVMTSGKQQQHEALDFSGSIHFEIHFTSPSSSTPSSSLKEREYMLLDISDDEEMLTESLSNIRVETSSLQEETIPLLLHTQLYDSYEGTYIGYGGKSLEYITGHEKAVKEVLVLLSQSFLPYAVQQRITNNILPHIVLTIQGNTQSGKSTILQVITRILTMSNTTLCHVITLDGKKLKHLPTQEILQLLTNAFIESQMKAPAAIIIDNIELVCSKFSEHSSIRDEKSLLVAIHLSRLLSDLYHDRMIHEYICQDMIKHQLQQSQQPKQAEFVVEEIVSRSLQHAVVVLLATESIDLLDDSLLHLDGLSTTIAVPPLLAKKKLELLQAFLTKENIHFPVETIAESEKRLLYSKMEGFVMGDLIAIKQQIVNKIMRRRFVNMTTDALQQLLTFDTSIEENSSTVQLIENRSSNPNNDYYAAASSLTVEVLLQVLQSYQAINASTLNSNNSRLTSKPSSSNHNENWKNIAGYTPVKQQLTQILQHPIIYRRLFAFSPLPLPRAVLLFGPPGCGKTFLAQAAGLAFFDISAFFAVRGPQLLDKYIGASEKAVRELFTQAAALKRPCLLFFDEFEALAPRRGKDNTGVTDRIVNQLLTFIDGVEGRGTQSLLDNDDDDTDSDNDENIKSGHQQMVFIMAASSRPDLIDPALLRPGRIEQHVYLGYPTAEDAKSILWKQLQQIPGDTVDLTSVEADTVINEITQHEKCRLMTPADLKAVVDSAYLLAVHEHLDNRRNNRSDGSQGDGGGAAVALKVTAAHLKKAFDDTRPSISLQDRQFYENIHHRFLSRSSGSNNKSSSGQATKDREQQAPVSEEEIAVGSKVTEAKSSNRNNKKKKVKTEGGGNGNGSSSSESNNNKNGILEQKFIFK